MSIQLIPQSVSVPNISRKSLRREALKFAYSVTTQRSPQGINLIPFPGFALTPKEVTLAKNPFTIKGRVIILAFPAAPDKGVNEIDIVTKAASNAIQKFIEKMNGASKEEKTNIVIDFMKKLYDAAAKALIEQGNVKPAFLPYDNMSFTLVVITWIDSQSLGIEIINSIYRNGAEAITSFAVNLVKTKVLNELAKKLSDQVDSTIDSIIDNAVSSVVEQLKRNYMSCETTCVKWSSEQCEKEGECIKKCTQYKATLKVELNLFIELSSLRNVFHQKNIKAKFNDVNKQAPEALVSKLSSHASSLLKNNLEKYFSKTITKQFNKIFSDYGETKEDACKKVKESFNQWLKEAKSKLADQIKNSEEIKTIKRKISEKIEEQFNKVKKEVERYLDELFSDIENYIDRKFLETTFANTALKSNPAVFAVYAVAQGIFHAMQSMINEIKIKVRDASDSSIIEEHVIIIERDTGNKNFRVRVSNGGEEDAIEAKKSPSLASKAVGFMKGFIAGLASAIIPGSEKYINFFPSFCVVNVPLVKKEGGVVVKQFLAPPKPGIYVLTGSVDIVLGIESVADFLGSIISGTKKALGAEKEGSASFIREGAKEILSEKKILSDISSEDDEKWSLSQDTNEYPIKIVIPYLVLSPYFIAKEAEVNEQFVNLKMCAVYDFTSIVREKLKKLKTMRGDPFNMFLETLKKYLTNKLSIEMSTSKFSGLDNPAEKLVEELANAAIEVFKAKLIEKIEKLLQKQIRSFLGSLGVYVLEDDLNLVERIIAEAVTAIYVPVFNSEKMHIAPYLSRIGVIGPSINGKGEVEVKIPIERIASIKDIDSLEAVPVYIREEKEGERYSVIQVPASLASLEPLVAPLIALTRVEGSSLTVEFVSPITEKKLRVNVSEGHRPPTDLTMEVKLIVDGKEVEPASYAHISVNENVEAKAPPFTFNMPSGARVATIKIVKIRVALGMFMKLGVAVFNPFSAESVVFVDPEETLRAVSESK